MVIYIHFYNCLATVTSRIFHSKPIFWQWGGFRHSSFFWGGGFTFTKITFVIIIIIVIIIVIVVIIVVIIIIIIIIYIDIC